MKMHLSDPKTAQVSPDQEGSKDYPSLPEIIGMPPSTGSDIDVTQNLIHNSSLMLKITPCEAKFETGMSLFRLDPVWAKYRKLLNQHKFSPDASHDSSQCISVAVQADSFPTDTFTNEYGEHFLNKLTDVASSAFGEISQMMGKKHGTEAVIELGRGVKDLGGMIAEGAGGGIETAGNFLKGLKGTMQNSKSETIKGMAEMADRLIAGARIDFPMVWKNSSYSPTFSFNIRLWNPNPGNDNSTNKYIIGPLAALLLLALPQTTEEQTDSSSYNWPFFCKVVCPGIFRIHAGAITNISVTKGGEGGQIAFNQRVGMVDVRIDFINLHNSLIVSNFGHHSRPTLQGYLDNLRDSEKVKTLYKEGDYPTKKTGDSEQSREKASLGSQTITETSGLAPDRVPEEQKATADELIALNPIYMV